MAQIIVRLKCVTSLHVGNGDVNYNIIDNEVERDPITGYPTINASGVKGALREYFKAKAPSLVADIFGADTAGSTTQGKLRFLSAEMIAVAARASKGDNAYYLISSDTAMKRFLQLQEEFLGDKCSATICAPGEAEIEGVKPAKMRKMPFDDIYILSENDFRNISLPVLARNCLDNGQSTNLWYEEIVPRESVFFFPVLSDDPSLLAEFSGVIDGKIIQFGGNASIGYGLCKVAVMEEKK